MENAPPVVLWYKAYCFLAAAAHLAFACVALWANGQDSLRQNPSIPPDVVALLITSLVIIGVLFGILNGAMAFLPRKPWVYGVHLANLVTGTLTLCCAPLTLPLLVFWLKGNVREFFGA